METPNTVLPPNKNIRTAEMKKEITKMSELENKAMELNENEMNEVSGGAYKPLPYKPGYFQYQIQPGDTLSKIARMYNTTVNKLMSYNPQIKDRNLIRAGAYMYVKA